MNEQLVAKGFELFFPRVSREPASRTVGTAPRRAADKPLFPGYLFVHHELDKSSYVEIIKARGVVRVLGERWDCLSPIPNEEIDMIARAINSGALVMPHAHLTEGDRVRIIAGPLAGVSGIYLRNKPTKGLLVLSIELLHRSVALEVPAALVEVVQPW